MVRDDAESTCMRAGAVIGRVGVHVAREAAQHEQESREDQYRETPT